MSSLCKSNKTSHNEPQCNNICMFIKVDFSVAGYIFYNNKNMITMKKIYEFVLQMSRKNCMI